MARILKAGFVHHEIRYSSWPAMVFCLLIRDSRKPKDADASLTENNVVLSLTKIHIDNMRTGS